jgi:hypothetical protein
MMPQGKEWRAKRVPQTKAIKPLEGAVQLLVAVRPGSPEAPSCFASSVPMTCDDKVPSIPTPEDDKEIVDYNSSPEWMNLDIIVVHLFIDGSVPTEEEFAHLDLGLEDAIFQKPKDTKNHLKGHINGKPTSRMLVDGGAIVNLMPYSLFKNL